MGGWLVRFSSGLTRRANSVLPWGEPTEAAGFDAAVTEVEHRSAERWLAPTFQLWSALQDPSGAEQGPDDVPHPPLIGHHAALEEFLTRRGYRAVADTDVLWLDARDLPEDPEWDRRIIVNENPDEAWLAAVHRGLGRDLDPATGLTLRRLLGGVRSRFYRIQGPGGEVVAISKMSIVPDPRPESSAVYGGLYSLWVHPEHRRQGLARRLLHATFHQTRQLGLDGLWLQVETSAVEGRSLYLEEGFRPAASYRYLSTITSA